jgi:hypothetical protein
MATLAMGDDVMPPKTVATEGHSSDGVVRQHYGGATVKMGHKMPIAKFRCPRIAKYLQGSKEEYIIKIIGRD